jgi:hypothetical protein
MWGGLLQDTVSPLGDMVHFLFVRLIVYIRTSNLSAIWLLSPLPVAGLQI